MLSTVIAVFAHPDDESFICGGTLARLAEEGHRVVLVCATLGEMGRRMGIPPIATRESIASVREKELQAACEALGVARLELLHYRDKTLEIQDEQELAARVVAVFEEERPSAVITFHDPLGGHPDHCAIGRATTRAYEQYTTDSASDCRLFYVAWGDNVATFQHYEQPVISVVTVSVRNFKTQKLLAFRAHRTQSQLNRSVWGSERQGMSQMSDTEFFIHTQGAPLRDKTHVIGD